MSRPYVRLIGTLLLLTIRGSSSSVSRRLSNDDFFHFQDPLKISTGEFVPFNHTLDASTAPSEISPTNSTREIHRSLREEEEVTLGDIVERNSSYLVETSTSYLSADQAFMGSSWDQFQENHANEADAPWYLTYSRPKRNSSLENAIRNRNSNVFSHSIDENSTSQETRLQSRVITHTNTQTIDDISYNTSQSPAGVRIPRERRHPTLRNIPIENEIKGRQQSGPLFPPGGQYNDGSARVRPSSTNGAVELPSRRRYPRYQAQSLYPTQQRENARWLGHPLSRDPNFHPINDFGIDAQPLIRTQTSFVSPFQSKPQNPMQQYLWSLYGAQNEARLPHHENSVISPNSHDSQHSSSHGQQPSVVTPSPSQAQKTDHQHRANASRREESRSQNSREDNFDDSASSHSDKSRPSYQDYRTPINDANKVEELTTRASRSRGESSRYSQQSIATLNHGKEDRDNDDNDDYVNNDTSASVSDLTNLRVGKSLNIFSRYGFLTLSIKVRPPVGVDNYLFMENTAEVFQRNSYWSKRERRRHTGRFDDHFYIHFCENLNELLIAYFDHFTIEGVPKAHKAFTASLSVRDLARQFGINSSFLRGRFSFVLVRLFRRKMRKTLKGPQTMQTALDQALRSVNIGSEESVHRFVDRFGTHIIKEFEVGDMMYQTFVFGERIYKQLKNTFVTVGSESHLEQLQLYFSPRFATNVGNIQLASGNSNLTTILEGWSAIPEQLLYPTIFKVFDDPAVEAELERLEGEVVLSLKLDKITTRLPPSAVTRWMSEVLDNSLALYYHNLDSTRDTT